MGKSAEFIGGLLLFTGLFTRLACIILGVDMFYITFFVGNGKIWYDAQHPFMFVLMAALLFSPGPENGTLIRRSLKTGNYEKCKIVECPVCYRLFAGICNAQPFAEDIAAFKKLTR